MVNLITLNVWAGILHLASSIAFIAIKKKPFLVTTKIDYQKWVCDSNDNCAIASDSVDAIKLDAIMLIFSFSLISSIFHFLAVMLRDYYISNIEKGQNILRWVEYSISAPIMIIIIALLNGVTSLQTLLLIFFTTSTIMLLGYITELLDSDEYSYFKFVPHLVGWIPYMIVWTVIFITFGTSVVNSPSKPPNFVYAIVFTLFFLFTTFGINQLLYLAKLIKSYETSEIIYISLSFISKFVLSWMLFFGMLNRQT